MEVCPDCKLEMKEDDNGVKYCPVCLSLIQRTYRGD